MPTPQENSELALIRQTLQQMQEVQGFASHDVDGLSKQVVQIQQQLQAISRRLTTLEARIVQRSMLSPDASADSPIETSPENT